MATHYEAGRYNVTVRGQYFDNAKNENQTPFFALVVMPDGGKYERRIDLWLTEAAIDRTAERLETLGWPRDSFTSLDIKNGGTTSLIGKVFQADCKHEASKKDGKIYERWEFAYDPPAKHDAPTAEVSSAIADRLDALFNAKLKTKPKARPPVPQGVAPAQRKAADEHAAEVGDDGIPF